MTCYRSLQGFSGHSRMSLRRVWNVFLQVRLFLNVGQLLKQRWLERLQTVGSLSKYDKRDPRNNRFKLAKQQLNLHVHHVFLSLAVVARLRLQMSTSYAGSKQQTTIFFSFFNLKLIFQNSFPEKSPLFQNLNEVELRRSGCLYILTCWCCAKYYLH